MTLAGFAFEILVCVLLAAAAISCWRVDRRLRALRDGQDGLKGTISDLNDAVDRARASLAALDRAAKDGGVDLKQDIDRAQRLADELRFLSNEADGRADQMTQRPRRESARAAAPVSEEQRSKRRLEALKALR